MSAGSITLERLMRIILYNFSIYFFLISPMKLSHLFNQTE